MTLIKTILATFGSLFKFLKFASIFAPFAWVFSKFSGLLSFIPGGSILGIFGAIFNGIMWIVKWVFADFLDGFKEPQRLVARVICFMIMLAIGIFCGIKYDNEKAAQVEAKLNKMVADIKRQDDADKSKLGAALKAKSEAEARERAAAAAAAQPPTPAPVVAAPVPPATTAPAPAAAAPKRVLHAKRKDSGQNSGSWMSRFW